MALPAYDPDLIEALGRVFAEAALDELLNEMVSEPITANAATPDQGIRGALKGLDGHDDITFPTT